MEPARPHHPSPATGIALMVASMFCFAAMNVLIRLLSGHLPAPQMVFLRNVFALALIVFWVMGRGQGKGIFATRKPGAHLWRAGIGFMAMELWFYGLSQLPLTLATSLSFTTPIFATLFAVLILKEQAGLRRWLGMLIGFTGVLVMLRPGFGAPPAASWVVLLSSALMAASGVVVKSLSRTEKPETIVIYMALYMTPLSLPLAIWDWRPVEPRFYAPLLGIALFSTASHLMLTRAYRHAELTALLPFDFTRLVFTAIFAYFLFGEVLDAATLLGALIIVSSSLYIAHREAVLRRHRLKDALEDAMPGG